MRRWSLLVVLVLFALAACGAPPTTRSHGPKAVEAVARSADVREMLALVNRARSKGRMCGSTYFAASSPLAWNAELAAAAAAHSRDMVARDFFGHTGSSGASPGDRITAFGYLWSWEGENIAFGYDTPQGVMAGWLGSPGHCANIMRPQFTEMGVGRVGDDWTQDFAAPKR